MTAFLCTLALLALLGFGSFNVTKVPPSTLIWLQVLDVVMTLGLATLALWSYLS